MDRSPKPEDFDRRPQNCGKQGGWRGEAEGLGHALLDLDGGAGLMEGLRGVWVGA